MLIDARLPLQQSDMDFMLFLGQHQIPFVILSTKTDKAKTQELGQHIKSLNYFLDNYWESRPTHILTSAREKRGRDEILNIIEQALKVFKSNSSK
jgi:GTP-binding protein